MSSGAATVTALGGLLCFSEGFQKSITLRSGEVRGDPVFGDKYLVNQCPICPEAYRTLIAKYVTLFSDNAEEVAAQVLLSTIRTLAVKQHHIVPGCQQLRRNADSDKRTAAAL
jgi:hypothetical protein